MDDAIDRLFAHPAVARSRPPLRSERDALADRFGVAFPPSLDRLWDRGDGIALDSIDAHICGPVETLLMIEDGGWPDSLVKRGFVPLLSDHQSNYLALIVREPLSFRVAYLPHDDGSRLLYRDMESYAIGLVEAIDAGDFPIYELHGDYPPDAPRSADDRRVARTLMETDGENEEWNYAAQLLDASDLDGFASLLETNHFVRRDVLARMKEMPDPAIRDLLHRDRLAFEKFTEEIAQEARKVGFTVREDLLNSALWFDGFGMNLEMFFHLRNLEDAKPRIVSWMEDRRDGKDPRERPDYILSGS